MQPPRARIRGAWCRRRALGALLAAALAGALRSASGADAAPRIADDDSSGAALRSGGASAALRAPATLAAPRVASDGPAAGASDGENAMRRGAPRAAPRSATARAAPPVCSAQGALTALARLRVSIAYGGRQRFFLLFLPARFDDAAAGASPGLPLLLALHGAGSGALNFMDGGACAALRSSRSRSAAAARRASRAVLQGLAQKTYCLGRSLGTY
jgi:hypothetical protein